VRSEESNGREHAHHPEPRQGAESQTSKVVTPKNKLAQPDVTYRTDRPEHTLLSDNSSRKASLKEPTLGIVGRPSTDAKLKPGKKPLSPIEFKKVGPSKIKESAVIGFNKSAMANRPQAQYPSMTSMVHHEFKESVILDQP
jgi:hypothetical protein